MTLANDAISVFIGVLLIIHNAVVLEPSSWGRKTLCVRCGRKALHIQKKVCAQCGYSAARRRSYYWSMKRRRKTGTGRMRYLKKVKRKFRNGFREGTEAKPQKRKGQPTTQKST